MGEIKAEDAKVFGRHENLDDENKVNVKLPKRSFKDGKTERAHEFEKDENPEITKIDDAEKFISENKSKRRLRFGEERKTGSIKETIETPKIEDKIPENENEEELNEIETGDAKTQEVEKDGVVYEYRENK